MKHLVLFSNHLNKRYIEPVHPDKTTILLSKQQFTYFKFHQFRILYHMAASKHFANENNIEYVYVEKWKDFFDSLPKTDEIIYYLPNDIWMKDQISLATKGFLKNVRKDINFYFIEIEKEIGVPPYKLNPLYQRWRKKFNILMDDGLPIGGKYSYDKNNRNRPPKVLKVPDPLLFELDKTSLTIYEDIKKDFSNYPSSNNMFMYPISSENANKLLDHFINYRLPLFGQYQDAMMEKRPYMIHSLLSASINLGLLYVKDVIHKVEEAYHKGIAPIESVEGFIRQVIGWREYIRGIYFAEEDKAYHLKNEFNLQYKKPQYMYDANTSLKCLNITIKETIQNAYNHHIQRLMVIGNISNLIGISPQEIREWFNEMYIDSFDWVVSPNVLGMAMYADGGLMSTKPYISSANYINKMSDYCSSCQYHPKEKYTENACPINALYYTFLNNHKDSLETNPRMKYMYFNLNKLSSKEMKIFKIKTKNIIEQLNLQHID